MCPAQDLAAHNKKTFDEAPKSVWDPSQRIADQDRDGVRAEVIYTSMGMPLFGLDDAELRAALFRAFNDWACEYCSYDLKRLVPLGLITLEDIPGAVAELTRIAKKGMRGAMIWAEPPTEKPYSDAEYEPFWAAAPDLNMPLSLHILTARGGTGADPTAGRNFLLSLANLHHQIERSISVLVFGGVLEKFPKLRIVSAENDVGWMAYFMYRLDTMQNRLGADGRFEAAAAGERVYQAAGLRDLHLGSGLRRFAGSLRPGQHHVVVRLSAYGGDLSALARDRGEALRHAAGGAAGEDRARDRGEGLRA